MTKEKAQEIVDELFNEYDYNVDIHPYRGEYSVQISEKRMSDSVMYINPKIAEVCHKRGCGMAVHNIGDGQKYMRIVLL